MTRRSFLAAAAAAATATAGTSRFGIATTCFMSYRKPKDTLEFLEYAHSLGAVGIQAPLSSMETDYVQRLERRSKDLGMYVEVMASLPGSDASRFEATLQAAKRAGSLCVRSACLSGRRYETFASLSDWKTFERQSQEALERAIRIAEKHAMPIALENHKDWTADELLALIMRFGSRYLGVCLDTGNNMALLEDPYEVIDTLAPYAISTHIKDMGVDECATGFLLSEMPLGKGILDMQRVLGALAGKRLTLEMITRDPLEVPALTDKYWTTFPERSGIHLARTLRTVKDRKQTLPRYSSASRDEQLAAEENNVKRCLRA